MRGLFMIFLIESQKKLLLSHEKQKHLIWLYQFICSDICCTIHVYNDKQLKYFFFENIPITCIPKCVIKCGTNDIIVIIFNYSM